jgi:dipeptidyl aminopeptidase/acylaminoacyl peptidase
MNTATHKNKRPLALDDLQRFTQLSSASVSADGSLLAYVTTKVFMQDNTTRDSIVVLELTTGSVIKEWAGSAPQWSPIANELAFLNSGDRGTYIWIYSVTKDATTCLAPVYESDYFMGHLSTKNFLWSPDGQSIAYVSTDKPGVPVHPYQNVKVIDRLLYKTRGGGGRPAVADNRLSHVWVVAAKGGDAQLITDTVYNEHSITWSPDSTSIAFVSNRSADPDNNQLHDLWSIDLNTYETKRYTKEFGTVYQPAWSPDGNAIAFLGTRSKVATNDSPAEDTQLYTVQTSDFVIQCVTQSFDRRIEQLSWHPQGNLIYFTAGNEGTTAIYRVAVTGEYNEHVEGEECQVLEYTINRSGNEICFISTRSAKPAEIFIHNLATGIKRQVTNYSEVILRDCLLQESESFWFPGFDEKHIQGWVIKPVLFNPEQKYPLVLVIHGGPHNMFGFGFEDRMQLLSASGYGVLYINPRGSSGYGQAFSNGCVLNWGGGDYKDLMAGVDTAIRQNSWIDVNRLGVTGQSYGGYMTNWIVTQTTRFKAAVTDGGISNLISFAGTSLYHSLIESEFNGSAYDNFPLLWQWSPLRDIKNVRTPTLILHGEADNEVPLSQAEEFYIALKKLGVNTCFIQYVGEGHGWRPDLTPANRADLLARTLDWFDKHLGG